MQLSYYTCSYFNGVLLARDNFPRFSIDMLSHHPVFLFESDLSLAPPFSRSRRRLRLHIHLRLRHLKLTSHDQRDISRPHSTSKSPCFGAGFYSARCRRTVENNMAENIGRAAKVIALRDIIAKMERPPGMIHMLKAS